MHRHGPAVNQGIGYSNINSPNNDIFGAHPCPKHHAYILRPRPLCEVQPTVAAVFHECDGRARHPQLQSKPTAVFVLAEIFTPNPTPTVSSFGRF